MAKTKAVSTSIQPDLFQRLGEPNPAPAQAADLDLGPELLGAINTVLREVRKDGMGRERVADAMNRVLPDLERPITPRQINAWCAKSKEYHELPARYLAAFCAATGSELPLRVIAHALGFDLIDQRERVAKELGETLVSAAQLKRRQRELQSQLEG